MIKDLNVITIWSSGAERLFSYAAEEAIGQPGEARRLHKLSTLVESSHVDGLLVKLPLDKRRETGDAKQPQSEE